MILSADDRKSLLDALSTGASDYDAGARVGIGPDQLAELLASDPELADAADRARAFARVEALALIRRAALGFEQTTTTETIDPRTGNVSARSTIKKVDADWQAGRWLWEHPPRSFRSTKPRRRNLDRHSIAAVAEVWRTTPRYDPAARRIGVSPRTIKDWLARGREYRDYLEVGDLPDADAPTRKLYLTGERLWAVGDRQAALVALALVEQRLERPDEQIYLDLLLAREAAVGDLETELVGLALDDARANPARALKLLQAFFPGAYNGVERIEVSGPAGGPIEVTEASRAQVEELLDEVERGKERLADDA